MTDKKVNINKEVKVNETKSKAGTIPEPAKPSPLKAEARKRPASLETSKPPLKRPAAAVEPEEAFDEPFPIADPIPM